MNETSTEVAPKAEEIFTSETFANGQELLGALEKHLTENSANYEGGNITIILSVNGRTNEIEGFLSPVQNKTVFTKDVEDILSDAQDVVNKLSLSQMSGGTDGEQGRNSYKFTVENF